jgi:molybdopterin molybdotransferase
MIPLDRALQIVLGAARQPETETATLDDAHGRILAQDVTSDTDVPPFDKSAMDGYACRREDLRNELTVMEEIPAGHVPTHEIKANQCSKIMTGAMVPQGADCVIMVEFTKQVADDTIRFIGTDTSDNICLRAEDIKKGDVVLSKGVRLGAQHIAILAMTGCTSPLVYRRQRVGVVATGNELVTPDTEPAPSQIRNSNSYQICAHVRSATTVSLRTPRNRSMH